MEKDRPREGIWIETADAPPARRRSRAAFAKEHASALWRLFFIQSSRNERTLDGLGFFSIIAPFISKCSRPGEDAKVFARRHLGYFNAGLYLSSAVAGVVVNMEQRRARGEPVAVERIESVKAALSSVLAARANYFFDALLIPLGLTIASISAMYGGQKIYVSCAGLIAFLVLYNFYHFQSRIGGYLKGAELGEGVGGAFVARLYREERLIGGCAAFAAGVFAALLFVKARDAGGAGFVVWGVVACAASAVLAKKLSFVRTVVVLFAATAIFLIVGGIVK
jgi:mannose/fructose/N-acetylgalactosamine-specific phosphotransferase system component IID